MATYDWESGVTGSWRIGANWSGGIQPTSGDLAIINAAPVGTSYYVKIDKPVIAGDVVLDQAAAHLTVASVFDVGNLELQAGTLLLKGGPSPAPSRSRAMPFCWCTTMTRAR